MNTSAATPERPFLLHLGDDVKWNTDLYAELQKKFTIVRSYSMKRAEFKSALEHRTFGDFVAIYRPFWNTGGREMGNWDEELISLLPASCKIFACAGAGFDWVDVKFMAQRSIIYCNAAPACTESVADAAIWLILSTYRRFTWAARAAKSLDPAEFQNAHENLPGVSSNPNGTKLGIIGLGRIGLRIAQKAKLAFDMQILYNDVHRMSPEIESSVGAQYFPNLKDMLAEADCVVLATPFVGEKVMNAECFQAMKHGSRIVNIGRGKTMDEESLVIALESGQISCAGLDVHFDEPNVNRRLAAMDQVEMLPHIAGGTVDSHKGFELLGMQNIIHFFDRGEALTPVNLQWLQEK